VFRVITQHAPSQIVGVSRYTRAVFLEKYSHA
jgi:hypothetical protein